MLHCADNALGYDYWLTEVRSHQAVLDAIALAGFGQVTWAKGRLGVAWAADEQPLSGVVNMATIKRSTFQVDYTLANAADGVEYTFLDRNDWQPKPLRVAAPGVTTMLSPAQVQGEGVTREEHAAQLARWHLAQSLYQYKDIRYATDLEHLSYRRLSVLALQHDLTQWGYGGRLMGASIAGGTVTLELDEPVPPPASGNAYIGLRIPGERVYRVFGVQPFAAPSRTITLADAWPGDAALPGAGANNPAHDTIWVYDFRQTPGYRVRVVSIEPESDLRGARVAVVPESPEFWVYVRTGEYTPPANQSLLQTRPVASGLRITEAQVVQGDTVFTELQATFEVSGQVGVTVVSSAYGQEPLEEVAQTFTRSASWRIPGAGTYTIVVRPYSPEGNAGVPATMVYTTAGADPVPPPFDHFAVEELAGGVRRYSWGYDPDTIEPPDLAGAEIRYTLGSVAAPVWEDMTPLGNGYHTAAFEAVLPAAGTWTFAARARTTSGALSEPRVHTVTLSANLGEVIGSIDPGAIIAELIRLQLELEQERVDRFEGDALTAQQAAADLLAQAMAQQAALDAERAAREAEVAAAVARLDAIDDDEVLSPVEKPPLRLDYQALLDERAGITQQAQLSEATAELAAYDDAMDALIAYMATLTTPVRWDDTSDITYLT